MKGHELTVVQMKFSNSGNYLLSVSRDRSWKLFRRRTEETNNNENSFELARSLNSKNPFHTRIIWSCDWSHDDQYFVTTSRDKRACIWEGESFSSEQEVKPVGAHLELEDAITAVAFAPDFTSQNKK